MTIGTLLLLLRIPGIPPWDSLYLDDYGTFFVGALEHPWQLFTPQHGYVQVLPHLVAQLAAQVPLNQVPRVFALSGALIAAACGLYVFHASAGHIRSTALRALLGAAIVLLPMAPLEIADNTLGVPWYMLLALFWAVLWRPRTAAGVAVTAVLAFMTAASTTIAALFLPLLALRVYVLRRPRDHVVTGAWLAGCLVQVPAVASTYLSGKSPLVGGTSSSVTGMALSFYGHDVVLPSLGWHLSWLLQSHYGRDWATAVVAAALAVAFGLIFATQPQNRLFVLVALVLGFLITIFSTILVTYPSTSPPDTPTVEWGARYTALPIFMIESAIIVGVDCALRRSRAGSARGASSSWPRRLGALPAMALAVVLLVSWVPDFRYDNSLRANYATTSWAVIATKWWLDCAFSWTGVLEVRSIHALPAAQAVPCDRLHSPSALVPLSQRAGRRHHTSSKAAG